MPTIYKPKKQKKKDNNFYDQERRKIYNTIRWRNLRKWKFDNNSLCEKCIENGIVNQAEDIHHIVSFMSTDDPYQREILAYDPDNLMSLCKKHHQEIHNRHFKNKVE